MACGNTCESISFFLFENRLSNDRKMSTVKSFIHGWSIKKVIIIPLICGRIIITFLSSDRKIIHS